MRLSNVAALLALVPAALHTTGCMGELDDQGAMYPEPVGYTTTPAQTQAYAPPAQIEAKPTVEIGDVGAPQADPNGDVAVGPSGDDYADTDPSALTDFHGALDPYGTWVDDSTYGTVWVPSASAVGSDFSPYVSGGHWAYDDDYTWVSDYSWGWAPFHYGRWTYMGGTGWGWIPGRTYAGAWVSWRTGYDDWGYVGWAPLPPTYYWRGGYAYGLGVVPYAPYAFCASGELFRPGISGHIVTGNQVGVVASHTRPFVGASPGVGGTAGAGGHVAARPNVGPSPSSLGIASASVAHAPGDNHGLAQARAFAHPNTAASLGARPPAQSAAARSFAQNNRAAAPANTRSSPYASSAGRGWHSAAPAYSYGSRGYGAAPGATYRSPYSSSRGSSSYGGGYGGRSYSSTPYSGGARPYSAPGVSGGTQHATPSSGSSQHSSESSGGGYSGGYHGGGGYRGGGGGRGGGGRR